MYECAKQTQSVDQRRDRRLGSRHRHGSACPGHIEVEAVFRRLDRIRRSTQQPCVAARCRHAWHAAGDQRGMRTPGDPHGARPQGQDQSQIGVRPEELFLSRSAARAIRSASTGRRWWARAWSPSISRAATRLPSASSGCLSSRTPARAYRSPCNLCLMSISTATGVALMRSSKPVLRSSEEARPSCPTALPVPALPRRLR